MTKKISVSFVWILCLVVSCVIVFSFLTFQPASIHIPTWGIVILLFLISSFCEYIDSSLGMGYGTTLTPLLLTFGVLRQEIVPVILLSEFLTGFFAGVAHHREGNVNLVTSKNIKPVVAYLAIPSVIGVVVATVMGSQLNSVGQHYANLYIGFMIVTIGAYLIYSNYFRSVSQRSISRFRLFSLGTLAAFNKGVSGGGYGPLMTGGQLLTGVKEKEAIVITSICECFTCITGLIVYFLLGGSLNLFYTIPLCMGSMLSVIPAAKTIRVLPEGLLKNAIGWSTLVLGLFTCWKFFF